MVRTLSVSPTFHTGVEITADTLQYFTKEQIITFHHLRPLQISRATRTFYYKTKFR